MDKADYGVAGISLATYWQSRANNACTRQVGFAAIYKLNLSVSLALEYEEVAKRMIGEISLSEKDIDDILDFVISRSNQWHIFYLWRPQLKDPSDDMVLELAVTAGCHYILTYNLNDFKGSKKFGIEAITPKAFLEMVGAL